MKKTSVLIAVAAGAFFTVGRVAHADVLLNYTFTPGSYYNYSETSTFAALGGFTFNATTNTISNVTYTAVQTGTGKPGPFHFTIGTVVSPTQVDFSGDYTGDVFFGDINTYFFSQSLALGGTDTITGGAYYGFPKLAGGSVTTAVPEPTTWGLMLIGFGAIGMAVRRGGQRGVAVQTA